MNKRIAIAVAAAAALAGCGGASWVDPTTGTFSAQDSADVMNMVSGAFGAVARQPAQNPVQGSKALSQSSIVACAVSGNVTVTSSVNANCNASGSACTFNGNVEIDLNTCTTQNLIGTGGLNASVNGSETTTGNVTAFTVTEHVQGGITVKRASDQSIVGTCGIFLDATVTSDGTTETVHVTGSICKQAVAQ